jgi:two-component system chemotaxis response regulator CheY
MPKLKGTILIVDDNREWRRILREILREAGYLTLEAESGTEALELARSTSANLVFADLNMPGLSGLETAERLRALEGFESVPIILLTEENFEGDCEDPPAPYINGYLRKKDALDKLVECVESHI